MKEGEEMLNKQINDSAHISPPLSPKKNRKINTGFFIPTERVSYTYESRPLAPGKAAERRRKGMPYCELHRSVAEFYLTELKYFQLRKERLYSWHYKYEEYYTKKITELSEILVRYSISALLGEVRHVYEVSYGKKGVDYSCLTDTQQKKITKLLKPLYSSLGLHVTPGDKNAILSIYVPESLWLRHLYVLQKLFNKQFRWKRSFGGTAWRKGTLYTLALYKQICLGDRKEMIIAYDTLINHCHNTGMMLNKFNCSRIDIKEILRAKQEGKLTDLRHYLEIFPCRHWENKNCCNIIGIRPLKTTEGYCSATQEKLEKKPIKIKQKSPGKTSSYTIASLYVSDKPSTYTTISVDDFLEGM